MQSKVEESVISNDVGTVPSKSSLARNGTRRDAWQVAGNIFVSFKYAWAGVSYAFRTQRNFRIHCAIGAIGIVLGSLLQLSPAEMAIVCLTSGLVLTLELLNTAIEAVVDLTVQRQYHDLAKIAKDCAAGAVLISAMAALTIAAWLMGGKMWTIALQVGDRFV